MIANCGFGRWHGEASFADVIAYVARVEGGRFSALAGESLASGPLQVWTSGVSSLETAAVEMEAVASQSKCAGPVYHLICSFGPDERPSHEQLRLSVDRHVRALDLDGLQWVFAVHDDGAAGMVHVHGAGNRVDPLTFRARAVWQDRKKMRTACREIEREDGWRMVGSENVAVRSECGTKVGASNRNNANGQNTHDEPAVNAMRQDVGDINGNAAENAVGEANEKPLKHERRDSGSHVDKKIDSSIEDLLGSSVGTNARDLYGMRRRFRTFVAQNVRPALLAIRDAPSATWGQVTDFLRQRELRYEVVSEVGARIVGVVSGFGCTLSALDLRHRDFVASLGEWSGVVSPARAVRDDALRARVDQAREVVDGIGDLVGWAGVHASLAALRLGFEKRQNGAQVVDFDGPGWLRIDRSDPVLSVRALTARFGAFERSRVGRSRDAVRDVVRHASEVVAERLLLADRAPVLTTLFHTRSAVTPEALRRDIARRLDDDDARERVRQAVLGDLLAVSLAGEALLTAPVVLADERRAISAARALAGQMGPAIRSPAAGGDAVLSQPYASALAAATDRFGRLKVVIGLEASDQAAFIDGVADRYRSGGYRVRALVPTRAAVTSLLRTGHVPVGSIGAYVHDLSDGVVRDVERLNSRDVVVLADAGAVGTQYGAAFLEEANAAGAIVIALSQGLDGHAVARGDTLRIMRTAVGPRVVDLSIAAPLRDGAHVRALQALGQGHVGAAYTHLAEGGLLIARPNRVDVRQAAIGHWLGFESRGIQARIVTSDDQERRSMTDLARVANRSLGRLSGSDQLLATIDGNARFAIGDRVVLCEPIGGRNGAPVGAELRVRDITGCVLALEWSHDRSQARRSPVVYVDTVEHPGVRHAYVTGSELIDGGARNAADLVMLGKQFSGRSVSASMRRAERGFVMFYADEDFRGGLPEVIQRADRTQGHVLVLDAVVRGRADRVALQAIDREIHHEIDRNADSERERSRASVDFPR